jgi:carboxymethylenebutenolidase
MPDEFISDARQMPPTLLLHGEADPVVPVGEARKVDGLLERLGIPHELKIYAGQGHSFRGMAQVDALTRTLRFLNRHLKKKTHPVG